MALSSCETEYIATTHGASQAQWMNMLMKELRIQDKQVTKLKVNNKFAIHLAKDLVAHGRNKLRDQVSFFERSGQ